MPDLSVNSLKANLTNPSLPFLYDVIIPNIPGGVGDTETMMLRCTSTQMPGKRFSIIEVPYKQGPKIQFPGKLEYDHQFTCTFIESEDGAIMDALYGWSQMIVDDVQNIGSDVVEYKRPIYLNLVTRASNSVYRTFRLDGCFISNIASTQLSYDSDTKALEITVTFQYDSWVLEV